MTIRNWWRKRKESQRAAAEAEQQRKIFAGSVLMTQLQALTAASWSQQGGDDAPTPDPDLRNLFLANTIGLGFGPRAADPDARHIWRLLALELGADPIANYPTVGQFSMALNNLSHASSSVPPIPPSYEFWASIGVEQSDMDLFVSELRNLALANRDDMPTMFVRQLCGYFGATNAHELRKSFVLLLLHAGFTITTVSEDTESVSETERAQRLELAFAYEGRLLALAKKMRDLSKRFPTAGPYSVDDQTASGDKF